MGDNFKEKIAGKNLPNNDEGILRISIMNNPYQDYYSKSYHTKEAFAVNAEGVSALRSKLRDIPFSATAKILDVACGISLLAKSFGDSAYGFDTNPYAVKITKGNGIKATVGDVEKTWNYPNRYFDIVIASHIIEHVVNPDQLILQAKRVLKKNGLFIIVTPNLAAWFNRLLLLLGFQPFFTEISTIDKTLGLKFSRKFSHGRNPVGHLRIFTSSALQDILVFHGFTIIKTAGVEFVVFPKLLRIIDRLFSYYWPFASSIVVVAKKT